jgi:mono/diheme cytochrome c family protein
MVLRSWLYSLPLLLIFASCETAPSGSADEKIDAGRLYNIHCAACHKPDGTGGISGAKNLTVSILGIQEIISVIKNGQGDMMPFSSILNDSEIEAVASYVQSFKK